LIHTGGWQVCDESGGSTTDNLQGLGIYKLQETLNGKEDASPFVQPGDIISLPEAAQVFVVGYVISTRAIAIKDKPITVSRAIAMAGGPQSDSETSRIRIVRQAADGVSKQEII